MAVETRLGGAVASAFAVICVDGEVKIHYVSSLSGEVSERRKEVLCGRGGYGDSLRGGRGDIKYLSKEEVEIWITSGIDSRTNRFDSSSRKRSVCDPALPSSLGSDINTTRE